MINVFFQRLSRVYPQLSLKLQQARMKEEPSTFVKKTFFGSFSMSVGASIFLFLILAKTSFRFWPVFAFPFIFLLLFFYLMRIPLVRIRRLDRSIGQELVFAGRFLIIEIESGVPLYRAFVNVARNYKIMGAYFREIIDKIDTGTSVEDALNEAVELVPSHDFRRILWQIVNSLRTGSDISKSLNAVIEQISREQSIAIKEYGKKLNPLAMFYMIIAVILPSLGITLLIILSSFVAIDLDLGVLLFIAFFLGFIQYMFLAVIRFSRPAVEL